MNTLKIMLEIALPMPNRNQVTAYLVQRGYSIQDDGIVDSNGDYFGNMILINTVINRLAEDENRAIIEVYSDVINIIQEGGE